MDVKSYYRFIKEPSILVGRHIVLLASAIKEYLTCRGKVAYLKRSIISSIHLSGVISCRHELV